MQYQSISRLRYLILCSAGILGLSFFGRKIQKLVAQQFDPLWIAGVVFIFLLGGLLYFFFHRKSLGIPATLLVVAAVLISIGGLAVYKRLLVPVETLHFLLFSIFGWLSQAAFGTLYGIFSVCSLAIGDEILQYFLPDRVGDIHDVVINTLSGMTGLLFKKQW